jgi:16S rRNA processing protein RimM
MTERPPQDLLEVGIIRRAHGVRGDTYVELLTDREDRLAVGSRLWARDRWLTIESARRQREQRFIVHFAGIDDRAETERWTNTPLAAEPVDDPDALWVHELVGSEVVGRDGTRHGTCVAVVANPAHDLLELAGGALVPVVFVVGHEPGLITIDPPEGLFDLDER